MAADPNVVRTIIRVGQDLGFGAREITAALSAGLVESGLRNVSHGDRDSLGVFQQRPSQGWGTKKQIMDVEYAATQFFKAIRQFDKPGISPAELAARVQRPAAKYRNRYGQRLSEAESILADFSGGSMGSRDRAQTVVPVQGVDASQLTDTWGANRSGGRSHKGVDIFADAGTPVIAARGGTVVKAGDSGGIGGMRAWVRDDEGLFHYYAHMDSINVRQGQRVEAGQPLGGVGTSGNAKGTPPHLHYSVNPSGHASERDAINPLEFLKSATSFGGVSGGVPGGGARPGDGFDRDTDDLVMQRRRARDVMTSIMPTISAAASTRGGQVLDARVLLGDFQFQRERDDERDEPREIVPQPQPVRPADLLGRNRDDSSTPDGPPRPPAPDTLTGSDGTQNANTRIE